MRHRAKFCRNRSNCGRDMAIFRFFKMAAAAILDFSNFKFLTVGRLKMAELGRHAKFGRNRSKCGRDIWRFFDFSRWRPPTSWIFQISNFYRSDASRSPNCVALQNLVDIGQNAAEIWRFFHFSRWRPPPSWIFQISNF